MASLRRGTHSVKSRGEVQVEAESLGDKRNSRARAGTSRSPCGGRRGYLWPPNRVIFLINIPEKKPAWQ